MWTLHLSDLHIPSCWRDSAQRESLTEQLAGLIRSSGVEPHELSVVVCGDITNRGDPDGYARAEEFLRGVLSAVSDLSPALVLCPGNHDIVASERPFEAYCLFAWRMTGVADFNFSSSRTCARVVRGDTEFIVANSAYHADHRYGRVDMRQLKTVLREDPRPNRLIVTHHHLIPCSYDSSGADNCSVLRDAYELLTLAASKHVSVVLHGHLHLRSLLTLGAGTMAVVGAGSSGGDPAQPQFQCNLLHLQGDSPMVLRSFYFLLDPAGGRLHEIFAVT